MSAVKPSVHVQLVMQCILRAFNVSSQLDNSIKGMFIEFKCKEGYMSQHGKSILA